MTEPGPTPDDGAAWLAREALDRLIEGLRERGYRVVAPVPREGAVVWDEVRAARELPVGLRDRQAPGAYRLEETGSERAFDVVNGPEGLKRFFFAPREPLVETELEDAGGRTGFRARERRPEPPPTAFLGVRACDLAALDVQDRIFLRDRFPDPAYAARRRDVLLVAVSCTRAAPTCFCASMGTGPEATRGFDLALTELEGGFTARAGSEAGEALLAELPTEPADGERLHEERSALEACAASQSRGMPAYDLRDLLYRNLEHPRWEEVAERCLSCGNCTMVCPTCFCSDLRDEPSPDGLRSTRVREWSSCFDREHAQVHGANFRPEVRHRYRQWLVHKLASWIDQFDVSGCTGCGRCITWCPTGIDLTEEVAAIHATDGAGEDGGR